MRRCSSVAFLLALAPLALTASAASAGFCGNYVQVSSNAGNCPTCRLQIADNPEIRKYFVEASNGWSAELRWVDRTGERANGSGQWKSNAGGSYAGKRFRMSMSQQGKSLSMAMSVGGGGTVNARFRCVD
jgi:hypothetical protein